MEYSVNEEGVEALRTMSRRTDEAVTALVQLTAGLQNFADNYRDTLGPHKSELNQTLAGIYTAIKEGAAPAKEVSGILKDIADDYEEIIANDPFGGGCSGASVGASGGGMGAGGAVMGASSGGSTSQSDSQLKTAVMNAGLEWSNSLSEDESNAINGYTGSTYENINAVLRGIEKSFDPGNRKDAKLIHRSLGRASFPCDCTVYRGVPSRALGGIANKSDSEIVGSFFQDAGFMSTSLDRERAFDRDTLIEIQVPKGSHGAYLGYSSHFGHAESEVLFDCGQKMRITGARRESGKRIISAILLK